MCRIVLIERKMGRVRNPSLFQPMCHTVIVTRNILKYNFKKHLAFFMDL